ncbi:MAG: glycosyltransferase family 39 protein [Candidatus Shapirobacteria bacterium]|nr:glycosyltransferase family 39 protein [Candidatus Shapirobacteria bacterium]
MSSKIKKILFFVVFFSLTLFTRFYKLDWGNGYFFHPDENNMASSVLKMKQSDLNPHFFAYGQFPLFLTFFTTPQHNFPSIIITLRFWSAFFSTLSVFFCYLIGLKIFKSSKISSLFTLIIILTPGLIQTAHFGTTESILFFVFVVNIYLSIKISEKFNFKNILLASLISGIGLATKISSVILITPILLSLLFYLVKNKKIFRFMFSIFIFLLLTIIFGVIFSPYNLIRFEEFKSSIAYEVGVANGNVLVFYTRQFIKTVPYLFQVQKIFPYTNGLPILLFSFFGLYFVIKSYFLKNKLNIKLLLILIPSLIFFLYQGQLFVKWTRFMSPIFFVPPLLAIYFFEKIKNFFLKSILVIISILPGVLFLKIYLFEDIRVQASGWIDKNIPDNSIILSESGNVLNLPLSNKNFDTTNFNFYELDNFNQKQNELNKLIQKADYILIPSRRVFKNQNNNNFPESQNYYQNLFSGNSNFSLIKIFSINNSFLLDPENAEETWSVFDNPTIRIFKRNEI